MHSPDPHVEGATAVIIEWTISNNLRCCSTFSGLYHVIVTLKNLTMLRTSQSARKPCVYGKPAGDSQRGRIIWRRAHSTNSDPYNFIQLALRGGLSLDALYARHSTSNPDDIGTRSCRISRSISSYQCRDDSFMVSCAVL